MLENESELIFWVYGMQHIYMNRYNHKSARKSCYDVDREYAWGVGQVDMPEGAAA